MNGYLTPLRRKIGVLSLMLACVLAAGWIRGLTSQDLILFGDGQRVVTKGSVLVILTSSARDGFVWSREECEGITWLAGWQVRPAEGDDYFDPFAPGGHSLNPDFMDYHWRLFGFETGKYHENNYGTFSFWRLSHSSIVLPLTLISAWLLLSRPKQQKSTLETLV